MPQPSSSSSSTSAPSSSSPSVPSSAVPQGRGADAGTVGSKKETFFLSSSLAIRSTSVRSTSSRVTAPSSASSHASVSGSTTAAVSPTPVPNVSVPSSSSTPHRPPPHPLTASGHSSSALSRSTALSTSVAPSSPSTTLLPSASAGSTIPIVGAGAAPPLPSEKEKGSGGVTNGPKARPRTGENVGKGGKGGAGIATDGGPATSLRASLSASSSSGVPPQKEAVSAPTASASPPTAGPHSPAGRKRRADHPLPLLGPSEPPRDTGTQKSGAGAGPMPPTPMERRSGEVVPDETQHEKTGPPPPPPTSLPSSSFAAVYPSPTLLASLAATMAAASSASTLPLSRPSSSTTTPTPPFVPTRPSPVPFLAHPTASQLLSRPSSTPLVPYVELCGRDGWGTAPSSSTTVEDPLVWSPFSAPPSQANDGGPRERAGGGGEATPWHPPLRLSPTCRGHPSLQVCASLPSPPPPHALGAHTPPPPQMASRQDTTTAMAGVWESDEDEEEGAEWCLVPPLRFATVEEDLYRGGYPTLRNFTFFLSLGIKGILCMTPEKPTYDLQAFAESEGVALRHITVGSFKGEVHLSSAEWTCALEFVLQKQHYPLYMHCLDGRHVVGMLVLLLRRLRGWNTEASHAEYIRYTEGELQKDRSSLYDYAGPITLPLPLRTTDPMSILPSWLAPRFAWLWLLWAKGDPALPRGSGGGGGAEETAEEEERQLANAHQSGLTRLPNTTDDGRHALVVQLSDVRGTSKGGGGGGGGGSSGGAAGGGGGASASSALTSAASLSTAVGASSAVAAGTGRRRKGGGGILFRFTFPDAQGERRLGGAEMEPEALPSADRPAADGRDAAPSAAPFGPDATQASPLKTSCTATFTMDGGAEREEGAGWSIILPTRPNSGAGAPHGALSKEVDDASCGRVADAEAHGKEAKAEGSGTAPHAVTRSPPLPAETTRPSASFAADGGQKKGLPITGNGGHPPQDSTATLSTQKGRAEAADEGQRWEQYVVLTENELHGCHPPCVKSLFASSLHAPLPLPTTAHTHEKWAWKHGSEGVRCHASVSPATSTVSLEGAKYHPLHLVPGMEKAGRQTSPTRMAKDSTDTSRWTRGKPHAAPIRPSHSYVSMDGRSSRSASVVSTVSDEGGPLVSSTRKLLRSPSALLTQTPKKKNDPLVPYETVVFPPSCAPFPNYAASTAWGAAAPFFFTAAGRSPKENTLESHLRSGAPTPLLPPSYETRFSEGGGRKKNERRKSH